MVAKFALLVVISIVVVYVAWGAGVEQPALALKFACSAAGLGIGGVVFGRRHPKRRVGVAYALLGAWCVMLAVGVLTSSYAYLSTLLLFPFGLFLILPPRDRRPVNNREI